MGDKAKPDAQFWTPSVIQWFGFAAVVATGLLLPRGDLQTALIWAASLALFGALLRLAAHLNPRSEWWRAADFTGKGCAVVAAGMALLAVLYNF